MNDREILYRSGSWLLQLAAWQVGNPAAALANYMVVVCHGLQFIAGMPAEVDAAHDAEAEERFDVAVDSCQVYPLAWQSVQHRLNG